MTKTISSFLLDQVYIKVTDGTCNRITSKPECEEAARQLGLSDTSASEETTVTDFPPYCYFCCGGELWFNDYGNSDGSCTSENVCICKNGKVECQ